MFLSLIHIYGQRHRSQQHGPKHNDNRRLPAHKVVQTQLDQQRLHRQMQQIDRQRVSPQPGQQMPTAGQHSQRRRRCDAHEVEHDPVLHPVAARIAHIVEQLRAVVHDRVSPQHPEEIRSIAKHQPQMCIRDRHYSEHALDSDTNSRACSYVGLKWASGEETWGCGTHTDIIVAGIKALVSAINNK